MFFFSYLWFSNVIFDEISLSSYVDSDDFKTDQKQNEQQVFNHKYSYVYPYLKLMESGKKDYD